MKRKPAVIVSSFVLAACAAYVYLAFMAEPATIPPRTFGSQQYESARDIVASHDGYLLAGMASTAAGGFIDGYLLKLDRRGVKQWENSFGGKQDDRFFSAIEVKAGGYAACGYTSSYGAGGNDFYLVRTDRKGNLIFQKAYGKDLNEEANCMLETADGGFILAGNTQLSAKSSYEAAYIVKTDPDGNMVWDRVIKGKKTMTASCIIRSGDGGYAISGISDLGDGVLRNMSLIRTDAKGNTIWTRVYGQRSSETGSMAVLADDGGYALVGTKSTEKNSADIYLVRTDDNGYEKWSMTYGGPGIDQGITVMNSGDGGFFIGANSESFSSGSSDIFIIRVDAKGAVLWSRNYGTHKDDYIGNMVLDGKSLAVCGWSGVDGQGNYDIYFFKSDLKGGF